MGHSSTAGSIQSRQGTGAGRYWIWGGFALLFVVHHDFWWWGDRTLVWGFLPIGLAYHAAFSIAAGLLWALASRYDWPVQLEEWAEQPSRLAATAEAGSRGEEGRS
jgi:hypothetical protein